MDWDKIDAVQRMQDYIVSHLDGEITLEALGQTAGYSSFYCIRIFKELTGKTPFDYIRALRLTRAAQTLRDSGERVLDVALESGFNSQDGFARAFARRFAIAPREYRRALPPVSYFTYYPIRHACLMMAEQQALPQERMEQMMTQERNNALQPERPAHTVPGTVTVTRVERPARRLILLRAKEAADYMTYCGEMGCDWEGLLNSIPEKLDLAALLTLPRPLIRPGTSGCAAGVEVPADYAKPLPEGYEALDLPPCTMLYFQGTPFERDEDFCTAIEIVAEAIAGYPLAQYGLELDADAAPRFNFGAGAKNGAKMALPVRQAKSADHI